jgi:hypothetical protein
MSVLADQLLDHWYINLGIFDITSSRSNNLMLVIVDYYSRLTILRVLPYKHRMAIVAELLFTFIIVSQRS